LSGLRLGIFDSGLGGLSVARAVLERCPSASIIYFADTAHVPYGDRPLEEVRSFALEITGFLASQGAGAVLMACNMSSACALEEARKVYPGLPVSGVVQAGARAAVGEGADAIAVLATAGTVASGGYVRAVHAIAPDVRVEQVACPEFVPLIEAGDLDGPRVERAAAAYLGQALDSGARVVILGCTHYPFLLPVLRRLAPPETVFVDPAEEAALEALRNAGDGLDVQTPSRFILSAPSATFRPVGSRFLGRILPALELAEWTAEGGRLRLMMTGADAALCDAAPGEV
jgi:glutamate racemase